MFVGEWVGEWVGDSVGGVVRGVRCVVKGIVFFSGNSFFLVFSVKIE